MIILENSVEREKNVLLIDMDKEVRKCEFTLLAMSDFLDFLDILRSCADFRAWAEGSRIIPSRGQ